MPGRPSTLLTSESRPDGLQDFVTRNLVRAIASGELPPGARLSDLGVSHIPVREALAALEAVGQVKRIPRVGFFVAEMSAQDIEDIYHWRQVLEDEAERLAVPLLTAEDLDRMRDLHAGMAAADNGGTYAELDRAFHFVTFERAGSDHLLRFLTHLWDAASRYHGAVLARVDRAVCQQQHEALLLAFDARDVDAVNAVLAAHRGHVLSSIRQVT
jgi:DNA-binding GntR family transcriptional regulator